MRPSGFQGRVAHIASLASLGLGLLGIRKALNDPSRGEWLTAEFLGLTA